MIMMFNILIYIYLYIIYMFMYIYIYLKIIYINYNLNLIFYYNYLILFINKSSIFILSSILTVNCARFSNNTNNSNLIQFTILFDSIFLLQVHSCSTGDDSSRSARCPRSGSRRSLFLSRCCGPLQHSS